MPPFAASKKGIPNKRWNITNWKERPINCVAVRAIRGAIQVDADERDQVLDATTELLREVLDRNSLTSEDLISVIFTATPDLVSEFPAYAARRLGFGDVPLICARELAVEGAMPRVVRMLAHVETDLSRQDITQFRGGVKAKTGLKAGSIEPGKITMPN